ncbi:RNA-directed DNA polymerase from mobile element jockey [Trichonephila clavipes]|nr:RNA-directed DNA polymerase from mobile element jockey [Trichonephila clavipes]
MVRGGMAYSDFEKAEVFKDTLEVTFQENEEPYCDDKIEEVESLVDDFSTTSQHARPSHFPSEWVPVVKYLGLHIDSRLTFKKHIDYLSEKFWGRISLAISLVGRSPLSLENKVILYKQILRPVITYGSPVWGAAAATHMKKVQVLRIDADKTLRLSVAFQFTECPRTGSKKVSVGVQFSSVQFSASTEKVETWLTPYAPIKF